MDPGTSITFNVESAREYRHGIILTGGRNSAGTVERGWKGGRKRGKYSMSSVKEIKESVRGGEMSKFTLEK